MLVEGSYATLFDDKGNVCPICHGHRLRDKQNITSIDDLTI